MPLGPTLPATLPMTLHVNGRQHDVDLDPRTTLLDALRDHLELPGAKKGCDHGQCGACTVLVDGRRANSCLMLAVAQEGAEITTIEGLSDGRTRCRRPSSSTTPTSAATARRARSARRLACSTRSRRNGRAMSPTLPAVT